jgi:hypothetical protein
MTRTATFVSFGKPGMKRTRLTVPKSWRKANRDKIDGISFTAAQMKEMVATRNDGVALQVKRNLTNDPDHLNIASFAREFAVFQGCCGLGHLPTTVSQSSGTASFVSSIFSMSL